MLGKLLLTFLVLAIAFVLMRQGSRSNSISRSAETDKITPATAASDLRTAAYMFLFLMIGTGAVLYYLRWQDDHEILTVNLHRDDNSAPTSYQVYRFQLEARSFVTTDGISVTVADNERMEVFGLD